MIDVASPSQRAAPTMLVLAAAAEFVWLVFLAWLAWVA